MSRLFGILLFGTLLHGATYYVATTGSDSSAGTASAPFATLTRGAAVARAGDTVLVGNGTYGPNGAYTRGTAQESAGLMAPVQLSGSGTASAPITFQAQNRWGAILDCQSPVGYTGTGIGLQACDTYFNFNGSASYYVISGFDIRRGYWTGAFINGNANTHITFIYNHFELIGNRVYDVPAGTSSYGIVGVYAGTGSSYITWNGNQFDHIGRLPHSSVINDDYSHDHGLYIYNGPYVITNNVFFFQPAGWNIQTAPGTHDLTVIENTLIGGANPKNYGCLMLWGGNSNILVQNNIGSACGAYFSADYQLASSNVLFDHNLTTAPAMISVSGTTQTANLFSTNPQFVSSTDYHLQAASPAIGKGASVPSITNDFTGSTRRAGAATIGAYEFGGANPPPPPPPPPPAGITYLPASLNFGSVAVGSLSAIKLITLANGGTASITVGAATFTNPAFIFGGVGTCNIGTKLAVGKTCTISVVFSPTAIGAVTATSQITAGGIVYGCALSGAGTALAVKRKK
jgi:hypothetical protein